MNGHNKTTIECAQESTSFERHEFAEYAKRLLLHKPAYLRLLTRNTSILNALPTDNNKTYYRCKISRSSSMAEEKFTNFLQS